MAGDQYENNPTKAGDGPILEDHMGRMQPMTTMLVELRAHHNNLSKQGPATITLVHMSRAGLHQALT